LTEVLQEVRDERQATAIQRELTKFEVFSMGGVPSAGVTEPDCALIYPVQPKPSQSV